MATVAFCVDIAIRSNTSPRIRAATRMNRGGADIRPMQSRLNADLGQTHALTRRQVAGLVAGDLIAIDTQDLECCDVMFDWEQSWSERVEVNLGVRLRHLVDVVTGEPAKPVPAGEVLAVGLVGVSSRCSALTALAAASRRRLGGAPVKNLRTRLYADSREYPSNGTGSAGGGIFALESVARRAVGRVNVCWRVGSTLGLIVSVVACSFSREEAGTAPPILSVPDGSVAATVVEIEVVSSAAPKSNFPEASDEVAAATIEVVSGSDLGIWIEEASTVTESSETPCDPAAVMLTASEYEAGVTVADEVVGALVANLDAALGAAAEWCRLGDVDAAAVEFDDARATARLLRDRLEELA